MPSLETPKNLFDVFSSAVTMHMQQFHSLPCNSVVEILGLYSEGAMFTLSGSAWMHSLVSSRAACTSAPMCKLLKE